MNRLISRAGAAIVTVTVFLFAAFMIARYTFGAYFVCMLLPLGYIMMAAGIHFESRMERRVAAQAAAVRSRWCAGARISCQSACWRTGISAKTGRTLPPARDPEAENSETTHKNDVGAAKCRRHRFFRSTG